MALLNYQNQLEQQNRASSSGSYSGPDDDGGSPDIDFSEPAKRIGGGLSNVASAAANLLNPFGYLMGNRSSGESLKNPMGNNKDWIYVAGMGRLTPQEVYNMVQSGQIQEVKNGGTVSYRRA